jgi:hypothetical protein
MDRHIPVTDLPWTWPRAFRWHPRLVTLWRNLAHRTVADLEATGMTLRLDTIACRIDVAGRKLQVTRPGGRDELIAYDNLVIGTGQSRSARRSPAWRDPALSGPAAACTSCTPWATPSLSCAR